MREGLVAELHEPHVLEPFVGRGIFLFARRVEAMTRELLDAERIEATEDREEGDLEAGERRVRRPEDEGLVAFVTASIEQRRRLGVRARDDEPRHLHDVELEARRGQTLDLLVLRDEDLASLVTALLHAGLLIFDVIPR